MDKLFRRPRRSFAPEVLVSIEFMGAKGLLTRLPSLRYTTEWMSDAKHECHQVAYAGGLKAHFDERDLKLQKQYRERRFKDQVADCFYYHKSDKYSKCYDITWTVHSNRLQRNELVSTIWRQLEATKNEPPQ